MFTPVWSWDGGRRDADHPTRSSLARPRPDQGGSHAPRRMGRQLPEPWQGPGHPEPLPVDVAQRQPAPAANNQQSPDQPAQAKELAMPGDFSEPVRSAQARAQARRQRAQYQAAVQRIQQNRELSREEKRQRLAMLHQTHKQAMDALRAQRHAAFRAVQRDALERLARCELAHKSTLVMDSYRARVEQLLGQDIKALIAAYDLAELMDDPVGMQAAALCALRMRLPGVPGDGATRLVARFANARLPDGSYMFPKASIGWENLRALEQWERADHISADAEFSVPSTPEPPKDPTPPDPYDAAKADVAALYSGNGATAPAAPAQGNGGGGEPAAP
jgi:hypothetical protein